MPARAPRPSWRPPPARSSAAATRVVPRRTRRRSRRAGSRSPAEHAAAHVTTPPRPDRLAVTKALTAIDPDQPELAAARAAGIPVEPWQQVVADAAVGRTLVAVAGTHGKSTTAGWLVHVLVAAGTDPSAFVGALLPSSLTGGPPATARLGDGPCVRRRSRRIRRQLRRVPTGRRDPDRRGVGPPRRVRRPRRGDATRSRPGSRRMPDGATLVVNVGDPRREVVVDRLRDRRLHVIAYALVDTSPGRGGYLRGVRERFATAAGPATALLGRIVAADPDGHDARGLRARRAGRRRRRPARHGRSAQRRQRAGGRRGGARARPGPRPDRGRARRSFAGVGRRLERKGEAGRRRGLRRLRSSPDGHPRDAGGHPPARTGSARVGRLRAADLPPDRGDARRVRRRPGRGRRGRDRRHLGGSRPGHDDHLGRGARRRGRGPAPGDPGLRARRRRGHGGCAGRSTSRRGDAVLVMGGGHSYRIGERCWHGWRSTDDRLCGGGRSARGYGAAWAAFDGDAWVAIFSDDAEYHVDPFGERARRAQRAARVPAPRSRGHNATSTSRSNATGCRARRCSPRGTLRGCPGPTAGAFGSPGS